MKNFKFRLASLSIFTILSLILGQVGETQSNLSDQSLILFNRRSLTGKPAESVLTFDINSNDEKLLVNENLLAAISWSPDGNSILARQTNDNPRDASKLIVIDESGENLEQLTNPNEIDPLPGLWSPDGNRVYFWARSMKEKDREARWAIYYAPTNGGEVHQLIAPTSSARGLAISPDGNRIIFSQDSEYYIMSSEGEDIQTIDVPLHGSSSIIWSPDGAQIATITSNNNGESGIYVMKPDGSNHRLLTADVGATPSLDWSPDSSEIIFGANSSGGLALTLGIANVETGEVDMYPVGQGVFESLNAITGAIWSPDSSQIVISGVYSGDNPLYPYKNLYLVDRQVTRIQRLIETDALDFVIDWRP